MTGPLIGIFVGGRSSRMGGVPKGTLRAPDRTGTLVERLVRVCRATIADVDIVLVGKSSGYEALCLAVLADSAADVGPLAGLVPLLATARATAAPTAIALACDLPFLTDKLLKRLIDYEPAAAAVAPRTNGIWQPLCARYEPKACLVVARQVLASGDWALHHVLEQLGPRARALPPETDDDAELRDWDDPADVER